MRSYSRAAVGLRRRRHSIARPLVRGLAGATLAASVALPLVRKRLRLHPAAVAGAVYAGPLALAVLRPRTDRRDVALYALQMWAFVIAHEIPHDRPERLRERLRIRYPIKADRLIGGGELPNLRLQRGLRASGPPNALDRILAAAHWAWFMEPHLALLWILRRDPALFPAAARQMAATYDLGCAVYYAVPTAPPWWAAENGYANERVERRMIAVGEDFWGPVWPWLYRTLGGNPWAAMPSLHFATSLLAARQLAAMGTIPGIAGTAYAGTLGFALVYLGEHYVIDLIAGAALVLAVRRGEPLAEPLVEFVNRRLRTLERIAGGPEPA